MPRRFDKREVVVQPIDPAVVRWPDRISDRPRFRSIMITVEEPLLVFKLSKWGSVFGRGPSRPKAAIS